MEGRIEGGWGMIVGLGGKKFYRGIVRKVEERGGEGYERKEMWEVVD